MEKKVILAGGTGFVGRYLSAKFAQLGYQVRIISRQPSHIPWEDAAAIRAALEDAELLINLAGKSVNCRYNAANKQAILRSRTETTLILGQALSSCQNPPPLWMNSSTATIYRDAEDRPMTEADGEIGTGFSVEIAKAWEEAFFSFQLPQTRQIALRMAIVLGSEGGVITPYKNLVKFGLGGKQGSGDQRFSWIHIEDLYRMIRFLQEQQHLSGVMNCSSPYPVTNREFMKRFRAAMHRTIGLPAAEWMIELGTFVMRTESEMILKSRWVVPDRLEKSGFTFQYPQLDQALSDLLQE